MDTVPLFIDTFGRAPIVASATVRDFGSGVGASSTFEITWLAVYIGSQNETLSWGLPGAGEVD